jgi:hypothetical protein
MVLTILTMTLLTLSSFCAWADGEQKVELLEVLRNGSKKSSYTYRLTTLNLLSIVSIHSSNETYIKDWINGEPQYSAISIIKTDEDEEIEVCYSLDELEMAILKSFQSSKVSKEEEGNYFFDVDSHFKNHKGHDEGDHCLDLADKIIFKAQTK